MKHYILTHLLTHLITLWIRVLLEKLTGFHLVKKFPSFYGTIMCITELTSARHPVITARRVLRLRMEERPPIWRVPPPQYHHMSSQTSWSPPPPDF